ncbi:phospho-N-acetylmuramoyl-pentapeptide-transferase [Paenibacillus hamazuiensis]|uniref:phospho-N-acetylmuramoyl-pentapeptide- transferase n=1 Tax=Paenibacillus hamazuiensis TaxID=2936508 RepID=UPI002010A815|nr:phospho-N-acetylmuramoyl-pentapeptide-transferase [Paenibacillus hamazuiensis]
MTSALGVAAITFFIVVCCCPVLIRGLRTLKLTQPIRSELPADHQAKRGTPLMAGIILLAGALAPLMSHRGGFALLLSAMFALFSLVGFLDDYKKAAFQDPSGISGRTKLILQFVVTGILLLVLYRYLPFNPGIYFHSEMQLSLHPGVYIVLAMLFIVGSANAINFTDGLDGLLIVVAIPTYFFFFAVSDRLEVQLFCLTMIGGLLGLLLYNIYPARAFMGDTGSLAIGGSLSFLAVIEKVEILIPLLFFVYFAEQLSVILQVWYYKKTKVRIFKMTPIHYHFSLKYGWSENKIVLIFGLVSWCCSVASWLLWKFVL